MLCIISYIEEGNFLIYIIIYLTNRNRWRRVNNMHLCMYVVCMWVVGSVRIRVCGYVCLCIYVC
uniref:Uncharacterized protein n=1 Tax=Anguilla anguilla TaxID=7936 RepID=A0A0E9PU42_ANGAN